MCKSMSIQAVARLKLNHLHPSQEVGQTRALIASITRNLTVSSKLCDRGSALNIMMSELKNASPV